MAKVKKTRKELLKEPDEFITTTGKLIRWAVKYQTQLTYGLIAVVVVAIGVSTYRYFNARAEAQAAQLLQRQWLNMKNCRRINSRPRCTLRFQRILKPLSKIRQQKKWENGPVKICRYQL